MGDTSTNIDVHPHIPTILNEQRAPAAEYQTVADLDLLQWKETNSTCAVLSHHSFTSSGPYHLFNHPANRL